MTDRSQEFDPATAALALRLETIRQFGSGFRYVILSGVISWVMWLGYKSILALSGKTTEASILAVFGVNEWLSYSAIALLAAGNFGQARIRKWATARLQNRITELELVIDGGRSSSRLLPDGSTRPEDL